MYQIDLNCDLGESYGAYTIGMDDRIIPLISSANIACGFHASDPCVMSKTVANCKRNHVAIGAHPGLPDLVGFGRRNISVTTEEAKAMVQYQVGALLAFCQAENSKMQHVKLHGALYNMAAKDYELAYAICKGIKEIEEELVMLVLAGSQMEQAAKALHMRVAQEVFADRAYEEDGTLVARSKPGAVIEEEDEVIQRVITMIVEKKVVTITGKEIMMYPDSVCVHGDSKQALAFVTRLNQAFIENHIQIGNLSNLDHI